MLNITFGGWPESLHDTPDQQKRIDSAKKAETSPSSIDLETQTGVFPGSGKTPYRTSLQRCTCQIFRSKGVPCKHIYRLAMECGLIDMPFETGTNKNIGVIPQIKWQDAIRKIEKLPKNCQLLMRDILYYSVYHDEAEILLPVSEDNQPLITSSLIICDQASLAPILSKKRKTEIVQLLNDAGIEAPKMLKAELIHWCENNATVLIDSLPPYVSVSFVPEFQKARRSSYSYLNQKFDGEEFSSALIIYSKQE